MAIDYPQNARPDVAERAQRIGWQEIQAQWIRNADHDKAEKSFFRINQGGTKIDSVEQRILKSRQSANALSARSIMRGGTGNKYWNKFDDSAQERIGVLGRDIYHLLFDPPLSLPIKTLDVPVGGPGYGPKPLPFVFDLVNVVNRVGAADAGSRRVSKDDLPIDETGDLTIAYLEATRSVIRRLCSNHPSSLGLHPALFFYAKSGTFQSGALLAFVELFKEWETTQFIAFTRIRAAFESFLVANRGHTEAVRRLGSGSRSRPRLVAFYRRVITDLQSGSSAAEIAEKLAADPAFGFFISPQDGFLDLDDGNFSKETKGAAFIQSTLPSSPKCPTCGGFLHRNGMQVGHKQPKRQGGAGSLDNAIMQHPFCNSTVAN